MGSASNCCTAKEDDVYSVDIMPQQPKIDAKLNLRSSAAAVERDYSHVTANFANKEEEEEVANLEAQIAELQAQVDAANDPKKAQPPIPTKTDPNKGSVPAINSDRGQSMDTQQAAELKAKEDAIINDLQKQLEELMKK